MSENEINIPYELFEQAFENLSKNHPNIQKHENPKAIEVWFDEKRFYVELDDRRVIGTPLIWFPRLLKATVKQRKKWEIDTGFDIHWEEIDEDILVENLL